MKRASDDEGSSSRLPPPLRNLPPPSEQPAVELSSVQRQVPSPSSGGPPIAGHVVIISPGSWDRAIQALGAAGIIFSHVPDPTQVGLPPNPVMQPPPNPLSLPPVPVAPPNPVIQQPPPNPNQLPPQAPLLDFNLRGLLQPVQVEHRQLFEDFTTWNSQYLTTESARLIKIFDGLVLDIQPSTVGQAIFLLLKISNLKKGTQTVEPAQFDRLLRLHYQPRSGRTDPNFPRTDVFAGSCFFEACFPFDKETDLSPVQVDTLKKVQHGSVPLTKDQTALFVRLSKVLALFGIAGDRVIKMEQLNSIFPPEDMDSFCDQSLKFDLSDITDVRIVMFQDAAGHGEPLIQLE